MQKPEQVLIIHGVFGRGEQFKLLADLITERDLLAKAVTLPGHESGSMPQGMALKDYVDFVDKLVGNKKSILVGHSLGALIAWLVAERNKNVIAKVLISGFHPGSLLSWRAIEHLLRPRYREAMWSGNAVQIDREEMPLFFDPAPPEPGKLGAESGLVLRELAFLQVASRGMPASQAPTQVIWGTKDEIMTRRSQEAIAREHRVLLETIEGTGHMIPEERLAAKILPWLEKSGFIPALKQQLQPEPQVHPELAAAE